MCPGSTDFMKCSLLNICCKLIVTNGNYSSDGLKGKMRLFYQVIFFSWQVTPGSSIHM